MPNPKQSHLSTRPPKLCEELLEPTPLEHRIAPALVELGLRRVISWNEARFVLDSIEHFNELAARRDRAIWRLLGGKDRLPS